jgi:hypothetical protein
VGGGIGLGKALEEGRHWNKGGIGIGKTVTAGQQEEDGQDIPWLFP